MDSLIIYTEKCGVDGYIFTGTEIYVNNYTYNCQRMDNISIELEFYHSDNLNDYWTTNEYIIYEGYKYYIRRTPNAVKNNEGVLYKYTATAEHALAALKNAYFFDLVTSGYDKCFTETMSVVSSADIVEIVARINANLQKQLPNTGWSCVLVEGTTSEVKTFSVTNMYIYDVLKYVNEIYEIPFYIIGKTIYFGDSYELIPYTFEYGKNTGLYAITKSMTDHKPITRITAIGGTENIPYYYPNKTEDRNSLAALGEMWITPQANLMPPIYRTSLGVERFYYAIGGSYENQYNAEYPVDYLIENNDIKPTIEEAVYNGHRIDSVMLFEYDANDNDIINSDGEVEYPYFYITIPPLGFNLYDCLSEGGSATISMRTGNCAACNFVIRNTGTHEDTTNAAVKLTCKKDIDTFNTLLPSQSIKPTNGDYFVFLNINLPEIYVKLAEKRLYDDCIEKLIEENKFKFTFDASFSQKFINDNAITITELSKIRVKFGTTLYDNYIESISIRYDLKNLYPEYTISFSETYKPRKKKKPILNTNFVQHFISAQAAQISLGGTSLIRSSSITPTQLNSELRQGIKSVVDEKTYSDNFKYIVLQDTTTKQITSIAGTKVYTISTCELNNTATTRVIQLSTEYDGVKNSVEFTNVTDATITMYYSYDGKKSIQDGGCTISAGKSRIITFVKSNDIMYVSWTEEMTIIELRKFYESGFEAAGKIMLKGYKDGTKFYIRGYKQ